jgi:nucleoside-specific outer membrane channel protein Tsx
MKKTLFALSALVMLASCKKDGATTTNPTKEQLVGSYKLVNVMGKVNNMPEEDITDDNFDECEQDDVTTLNADNTYAYADAGTQCSPNGTRNGSWSVSGNTFTVDGVVSTIKSFSNNNLVLTNSQSVGGVSVVITTTFRKQ